MKTKNIILTGVSAVMSVLLAPSLHADQFYVPLGQTVTYDLDTHLSVNYLQKTGPGTLHLNGTGNLGTLEVDGGTINVNGNFPENIYGTGSLSVYAFGGTLNFTTSERLSELYILYAYVTLTPNSDMSARFLLDVDALSVFRADGGTLDLTNNGLILRTDNSITQDDNVSDVYSYLQTGYDGGAWDGPGINSSTAAADALINGVLAVMLYDNTQLGFDTFYGTSISAGGTNYNQVLLKMTYSGDYDANGYLDFKDYLSLIGYGAGSLIYQGDLDFDGLIDFHDYTQLSTVSGNQVYGTIP